MWRKRICAGERAGVFPDRSGQGRHHQAREEKYAAWAWNYGDSPKYQVYAEYKFASGTAEIHLNVKEGRIAAIRVFGDFFGTGTFPCSRRPSPASPMKQAR